MKRFRRIVFSLLFIFCLAGCKSSSTPSSLNVTTGEEQFRQPEEGDTVAVIKTSKGTIKILLFPEYAPKRVENFRLLAENGTYDNSEFCRVIENMLIQAGSPEGTQGTGKSVWGIYFTDEFSDKLHNYTGAVGMINNGENTNGARFYFVTTSVNADISSKIEEMRNAGWRENVIATYEQAGGAPSLDYRYTVFGQIYEGLDVAYSIASSKVDSEGRPTKAVTIESIEIQTVGESEG